MTNQQIISDFLRAAYTDERLAMLLAHVEDGKFSFLSCCCIRGAANADHALRGRMGRIAIIHQSHYQKSDEIEGANQAEQALNILIGDEQRDEDACAVMLPLIRAEMKRRDSLQSPVPEAGRGESVESLAISCPHDPRL